MEADSLEQRFCRHQLYHFCPRLFQLRVGFFVFRQQRVIVFQPVLLQIEQRFCHLLEVI